MGAGSIEKRTSSVALSGCACTVRSRARSRLWRRMSLSTRGLACCAMTKQPTAPRLLPTMQTASAWRAEGGGNVRRRRGRHQSAAAASLYGSHAAEGMCTLLRCGAQREDVAD
eukprot:scaffold2026_cov66-Phaeocystis_antarctica.AAC.3